MANFEQIEINSYTDSNSVENLCRVYKHTNGVVVEVISNSYSDNHDWGDFVILTDKYVTRFPLSNYDLENKFDLDADGLSKKIADFAEQGIAFKYLGEIISGVPDRTISFSISLPTRKARGERIFTKPYMTSDAPVHVNYNGQDVSDFFSSFKKFGEESIDAVYNFVFGEINNAKLYEMPYYISDPILKLRKNIGTIENVLVGDAIKEIPHADERL